MVTIAAITGFLLRPTWINLHVLAGSLLAVLLLARIVWGVLGSQNARFSSFIKGPREVLRHIAEIRSKTAARHLGHNPLGALMIIALLGTIFWLTLTGASTLGGIFKTGPFGFATSFQFGTYSLSIHRILAYFLLFLIVLHLAGAFFESWRTRENLVKSIITGKKEIREDDHMPPKAVARPILSSLLIAGFSGAFVWATLWLTSKPPLGVPVAAPNPVYQAECSDCHIAYAPSLLPAKNWGSLMAGLEDHFGEDASLDARTVDEITTWLFKNASDSVDTKPAHVFSRVDPQSPFAITQTPFWKATHRAIPDTVFSRPPIYDNGNCAACHSDAESGFFYPANISIPKETTQ